MIVHVPILIFLLANASPADAAVLSRGSETLSRAARHVHRHVIKRSSGLLKDMRLAYEGIRLQQKPQILQTQTKLYCTNHAGNGFAGVGSPAVNGTDQSSGSIVPSTTVKPTISSSPSSVSSTVATSKGSSSSTSSTSPSSSGSPSSWKIAHSHSGSSFFDEWVFTNDADVTTHGIVNYVDQQTSQSANLTEINAAGNAIMRVETTPTVSGNRQSIRITTQYSYTGGLIILDAVHMPTGCGTWPAFWSNGPNWPAGGEIDMVEGVNDYTNDQVTLHATDGCTMSSSDPNALGITGSLVATTDCSVDHTGNAGCGVRASQSNSYGAPFNSKGGGVYATLWDNTGIKTWFFARGSIPSDINDGAPQPSGWGQPIASFAASTCDPFKYFYQHTAIFDTTLCGDWAGGVWGSAGVPGQEQSCAQSTGFPACEDYVRASGSAFNEAYWEVKSVKIYQNNNS